MAEVGDAPAPAEVATGAESGGDDGVVSFEDALKGAIEDTKDLPADEPESGDLDAPDEGDETKAKADEEPGDKKPEPKKDEKKEPEPDEAKVSEKNRREFAAIAKERGKLREREATLAAREEKLAAIEPKAQRFDEVRKRIHEDPVGLLKEAGGEELINKVLDQLGQQVLSPAEQEVAKLRRDLEERDARAKRDADAKLVADFQRDIREEVIKAGETFDLVNSLGEYDAVVECITSYHAKHKANLPVAIAAQVIEEALAARLAKSKKFGARGAVTPTQASTGTPPPKKKSNTTLSSVAVGAVPQGDDDGPMDEAARTKWAMGLAAV